jgi:hypothetical protein
LDQADALLGRGLASEARNASVVAGVHADRARELEAAAREQEAHELRLAQGRGEQVIEMVKAMFDAVDLSVPVEVAQAALRGEKVTSEVAAAARVQVRAKFRAELMAEVQADQRARAEPQAGEDEGQSEPIDAEVVDPEPDGGPTWEDLDESWKSRFAMNRSLGVHEYALALQRERRQREERGGELAGRASSNLMFRHPGLVGL